MRQLLQLCINARGSIGARCARTPPPLLQFREPRNTTWHRVCTSSRASRRLAGRGTVRNEAGIANGISGVGTDVAAPDPRRASATAVGGAPESARICRAAAVRRQTLAESGRALSWRAPCRNALNTQGITANVHLERLEPFEPGKPDSRQEPLGGFFCGELTVLVGIQLGQESLSSSSRIDVQSAGRMRIARDGSLALGPPHQRGSPAGPA